MRCYIVGYTYSGKSTFGRQLAEALGVDFVDTDRLFEQKYHYTVQRFFSQFGEAAFRPLEAEVLRETAKLDDVVVATGGGTPCYADNMDFILSHGQAVYLQMSVEALYARACGSRNRRPLDRELSGDELRQRIERGLAEREPYYRRATFAINGQQPQVNDVLWLLRGGGE
ncbi:MAG: shikimate kinase [Bacteroidales bacterium]|nr:shikimate kinase [Bacteroidales bacterium]